MQISTLRSNFKVSYLNILYCFCKFLLLQSKVLIWLFNFYKYEFVPPLMQFHHT
jgi:hypothetical protein